MKRIAVLTLITAIVPVLALAGSHSTPGKMSGASMDIVDMAAHTGKFDTLVKAIQAAGLEPVLRGEGPFTVFAPTDEAFAKLDPATLESLLKPENQADLQALLTYHVVAGKVMASDAAKMEAGKTVNGKDLTFRTDGGKVSVNDANVVQADVTASNGVIHIIDTVLIP